MNNNYEEILEWWHNIQLDKRFELKDKHIGNVISMGQLNESHVTTIYRKELQIVEPTPKDNVTREEVYAAIDTEREFQEMLWDNRSAEGNNPSSWILWMEDYLQEARHIASRGSEAPGTKGRKMIMDAIRKVTTMGVACMEVNGAPKRDIFMLQRKEVAESKELLKEE